MKQYIDSDQLRELTPNQFRKLCGLIGDIYHVTNSDERILESFKRPVLTMYISILQKTNIGQMMEILLISAVGSCTCLDCTKRIFLNLRQYESHENLCDVLWNEVKCILQTKSLTCEE